MSQDEVAVKSCSMSSASSLNTTRQLIEMLEKAGYFDDVIHKFHFQFSLVFIRDKAVRSLDIDNNYMHIRVNSTTQTSPRQKSATCLCELCDKFVKWNLQWT